MFFINKMLILEIFYYNEFQDMSNISRPNDDIHQQCYEDIKDVLDIFY